MALLLLTGCGQDAVLAPKPRAYPKVDFPERAYRSFEEGYCGFTFQYPTYAVVRQDTTFFEEKPANDCWFDLYFPPFDGQAHFTYYPVGGDKTLEELQSDAFELVDWHKKKANYIDELRIQKENGVSGFAFVIEGPAASPFQFFLTDSTEHFLRGALYFNTQAKPDSMAPVYEFVQEDLLKVIETFEWW